MECVFCGNHELDLKHIRRRIAQLRQNCHHAASLAWNNADLELEIQVLERTLLAAERDYAKHRAVHSAAFTAPEPLVLT